MSVFAILSPAKSMQFDGAVPKVPTSRARFAKHTSTITEAMRQRSPAQLQKLQGISAVLAKENADRWTVMRTRKAQRGAAVLCFAGDVYQGLHAATLTTAQQAWLQDHVRVLSGLYGLLRPMDVLQAYRLEMGTRLKVNRTVNLYAFWGDTLTAALKRDMGKASCLVNLASDEYAKAIDFKALKAEVISVRFLQEVNGTAKFMSFYAKRARGEFARWMAQHKPASSKALAKFDAAGYRLTDRIGSTLTFARPKPAPLNARQASPS